MGRRVFFGVLILMMFSGCNLVTSQTTNNQVGEPDLPAINYALLPAFQVEKPEVDLQKSKEYSAKAKEKAIAWKSDAQLARVELDYKGVSTTGSVTGKYFFVSEQDQQNVLEIVVTGLDDKNIKVGTIAKNSQNYRADYFQVLPLDKWKTTAAKALEVADSQGGGMNWRSAAMQTAKTYNGNLDNLHAIVSLGKINDRLVWSVTYLVPVNEKKGWGQWESESFMSSVFADTGELVK